MRFVFILAFGLLFHSITCLATQFKLVLKSDHKSSAQIEKIEPLLRQIENRLPSIMKEKLNYSIELQLENTREAEEVVSDENLGKVLSKDKIILYPSLDRLPAERVLGLIIYHLAHLYDRYADPSNTQGIISHARQYRRVARWRSQWNWQPHFPRAILPNSLVFNRSPEPEENRSIEEHFAVNFKWFLLDDEYVCRRPALSRYFENHFNYQPPRKCQINTKVPIYSSDSPASFRTVDLDPSRIFEIQYFSASPGTEIDERWGHAMLRLIVCNPERHNVDEDCRQDINFHLTVSHEPDLQGTSENIWSGLLGRYPFRVVLTGSQGTINYYTRGGFRNLTSVPLKLNPSEKEQVIFAILEKFWESESRFYFTSDNCTTEVVHLLQGALNQDVIARLNARTPYQLLTQLGNLNYLDLSPLSHLEEAIQNRYFIPSHLGELEQEFSKLKSYFQNTLRSIPFNWKNVTRYVNESTPEERLRLISAIQQMARLTSHTESLDSLARLEEEILYQKQIQLDSRVASEIKDRATRYDREKGLFQEYFSSRRQARPFALPQQGYGIPFEMDLSADRLNEVFSKIKLAESKLGNWAHEIFKAEFTEMSKIEKNLRTF